MYQLIKISVFQFLEFKALRYFIPKLKGNQRDFKIVRTKELNLSKTNSSLTQIDQGKRKLPKLSL